MFFKTSKPLIFIAFFAIYFIWGSTYLLNKIVVSELPPFFLASVRFLSAGISMMTIAAILKVDLLISKKQFLNTVVISFLFLVYGNSVFVWALQYLSSGFSSLIASTQPLFVLIIMKIIDRKPIKKKSLIGIFLGFIGMYLLVSQQEITSTENSFLGIVVMISCVLSWSYGSVFVSKAILPKNFLVSAGYQMIIGGLIQMMISICLKETWSSPLDWSPNVQLSMFLLVIFGGIIAFTAFNYLLKTVSTEKVATSAYVNPIIALFMGWYFLNEQLSTQSMLASVILLTGVYFIASRKRV